MVSRKIFPSNNPPNLNLTQPEKHFTYEREEIISIFLVKRENNGKTIFIFSSFADGFNVRSVFLDLSKAFDKAWNEEIIFKLKQNGISDDLLNILSDFLRNRKQRVTLDGQFSSWTSVNAGVPQGSILEPILF